MKALGFVTNELHTLFCDYKKKEPKRFTLEDVNAMLDTPSLEDAEQKLSEKDDVRQTFASQRMR